MGHVSRRGHGSAGILLAISAVAVGVFIASSQNGGRAATLYYESLHYNGGTVASISSLSMDLSTKMGQKYFDGGTCSEISHAPHPSRRTVAACQFGDNGSDRGFYVLDLPSGRASHRRTTNGRIPVAWAVNGAPVLLEQGERHSLHQLQGASARLLYAADHFIVGVVPMSDGTFAVVQSPRSVESCDGGRCGDAEIAIVRHGRVAKTIEKASPLIAFNEGRSLLYATTVEPMELRILHVRGDGFIEEQTGAKGGNFSSVIDGGAALSNDGRIAVVSCLPGPDHECTSGIFVFDPRTNDLQRVGDGSGPIAWAPDGSLIHSGDELRSIRRTDLLGRSEVLIRGEDVRLIAVL